MVNYIKLDADSIVPKYMQVINSIVHNITIGNIQIGDKIPSINTLSEECYLSRDTVERAYSVLKKKKVLVSVKGKGTYVSQNQVILKSNVLFLVNKLSPFKMKIYNSFVKELGENFQVDLHSYHCDESLFLDLLYKNKASYDYFVVLPHFRSKNLLHKSITNKVSSALNSLPKNKLLLLDNSNHNVEGSFTEVTQDFEKDLIEALESGTDNISKYDRLTLVYPKSNFYPYPKEIVSGFKKYCVQNNFEFEIIDEVTNETLIERRKLFVTIEESDLVALVKKIRSGKLILGKEVGVISYNDTPLKQLLGITVVSTNFSLMGRKAAEMVLQKRRRKIKIPFNLIQRESL